jgi:hypothetical protein
MALMCFSPAGGSDEQVVHPVRRYRSQEAPDPGTRAAATARRLAGRGLGEAGQRVVFRILHCHSNTQYQLLASWYCKYGLTSWRRNFLRWHWTLGSIVVRIWNWKFRTTDATFHIINMIWLLNFHRVCQIHGTKPQQLQLLPFEKAVAWNDTPQIDPLFFLKKKRTTWE